jgi:hypothetical protein
MRNDLTIYDTFATRWWSDDIRWVRTLKNLVPGRLRWFDRQIDWQGKVVLDLGCAGGFMAEALALRMSLESTPPPRQSTPPAPMPAKVAFASSMMWV